MRYSASFLSLLLVGCTPLPSGIESVERPSGPDQSWHRGPAVHVAAAGPARFVRGFVERIDEERIESLVAFADDRVAAPASLGYDETLDKLTAELRDMGFDGGDERLVLELIETPALGPGWTPVSGSLTLVDSNGRTTRLHAFENERDVERVMLPMHAPSIDLTAPIARSLEDLDPGEILVTDVSPRQVLTRARRRGAVAIVSASLGAYNEDPSGRERHLDAIQARSLPPGAGIAAFQISRNSLAAIDEELARGGSKPVSLALQAVTRNESRPLRTLVATFVGAERPDEAVVVAAHVHGPGAVDNASGMAGVLEGIRVLRSRLALGELEWPARSVTFVFGDELRQSEVWLEHGGRTAIAGISADMIGSRADSGAIALLEREPDPAAWRSHPPDEHSSWGGGDREYGDWTPSGLSVVARCALIDAGLVSGGWICADHPWEGGSDHDVFLEAGIPAVLFWHFTDFTYHTSLDRAAMVDTAETRRTAAAILSAALAIADPVPSDLDRYLRSLDLEIQLRVNRADEAADNQLAAAWREWSRGARIWLRNLCLGVDEELPELSDPFPPPTDSSTPR